MPTLRVSWDGQPVAGLLDLTTLSNATEPIAYRDLTGRTSYVPGSSDTTPVTLRRPVDHDLTFDTWARTTGLRKDALLELLDDAGTVVAGYRLHRCWVQTYAVVPDLATGQATESLTLVMDRWERLAPAPGLLAEDLARARGGVVKRVNLSDVVSQHLGETEQNLDRLLAEAQREGAVLLLEEADAVFGRRTDVQDAHDRYADASVSAVLDRLAAYQGGVVVDPGGASGKE